MLPCFCYNKVVNNVWLPDKGRVKDRIVFISGHVINYVPKTSHNVRRCFNKFVYNRLFFHPIVRNMRALMLGFYIELILIRSCDASWLFFSSVYFLHHFLFPSTEEST